MMSFFGSRKAGVWCALAVLVCAVVIWPVAETGIYDDWSYVRTAEALAKTGHVVYNGWSTAMLGWFLIPGALFLKVFGYSFTAARAVTVVEAMILAFVLQRTMVRAGLGEWNASLATLSVTLSPVFLPLLVLYMSDVAGLLPIVVCLYACLRAVETEDGRAAAGWLCFAALSCAVGGTARQIAWLGTLVMVPSAMWLLRAKRKVLVVGAVSYLVGIVIIFGSLHWYYAQAYSVPEALIPKRLGMSAVASWVNNMTKLNLEAVLLLLPVLLMFVPELRRRSRGVLLALGTGGALGMAALYLLAHRPGKAEGWLAPYLANPGNYLSVYGLCSFWPMKGPRPVVLGMGVRTALTAMTLLGLLAVVAFCVGELRIRMVRTRPSSVVSWWTLCVLLVPFTASYYALLSPRAMSAWVYDRYLFPVMIVALLLAVRLYQERVAAKLPKAALALVVVFAAYGVAVTHDVFAMSRASLVAIAEMQAQGVPRTDIDAGWEFNGWTEIDQRGYVNEPLMKDIAKLHVPVPEDGGAGDCTMISRDLFPDVKGVYALALEPDACAGVTTFAPVSYRNWLGLRRTTIYVVRRRTM
jgi:hypothetical protein